MQVVDKPNAEASTAEATGYRWDIVLTGRRRTPIDQEDTA
jgi:hypothetical protein